MSIDDAMLRDPRIKRLARTFAWSVYEARGRLLEVWAICYDRVTPYLQPADVDDAGEQPGLASAMVAAELATETPDGLRISGADKHVRYLLGQEESGRRGGLARAENEAKRKADNESQGSLKAPSRQPQGAFKPLAPDPDLNRAPTTQIVRPTTVDLNSPEKEGGEKPIRPFSRAPTARARAGRPGKLDLLAPATRDAIGRVLERLSARSGVAYIGADEHVQLIASAMARGITEHELRYVIGFAASTTGLGWQHSDKMRWQLRPETLFTGPGLTKYLSPAKAWAEKHAELQETRQAAPERAAAHGPLPDSAPPEIEAPGEAESEPADLFDFAEGP